MVEIALIAGFLAVAVVARELSRRRGLRRARARADAMLDDLAAMACARLADGSARGAARAVERYGSTRDLVAAATTRRELDHLVRRHQLRLGAIALATRGLERARDFLADAIPARR